MKLKLYNYIGAFIFGVLLWLFLAWLVGDL